MRRLILLEVIGILVLPFILLLAKDFNACNLMLRRRRHLRLVLYNFLDRLPLRHTPMPLLPARCKRSRVSIAIIIGFVGNGDKILGGTLGEKAPETWPATHRPAPTKKG